MRESCQVCVLHKRVQRNWVSGSKWGRRRRPVKAWSEFRHAECAQRRARTSYCNNSNCYSHSTKVPSAYKSLARHRRKCFCVFLYPGHKVLPSCCLFVSKRASERVRRLPACLLCVCVSDLLEGIPRPARLLGMPRRGKISAQTIMERQTKTYEPHNPHTLNQICVYILFFGYAFSTRRVPFLSNLFFYLFFFSPSGQTGLDPLTWFASLIKHRFLHAYFLYWNLWGDRFIAEKQKSLLGVYFDPSPPADWVELFYLPLRHSHKLSPPDFVSLTKAFCLIFGEVRCRKNNQFCDIMRRAFSWNRTPKSRDMICLLLSTFPIRI